VPADAVNDAHSLNTNATLNETTNFQFIVSDGVCSLSKNVLVKTFEFICGEPYVFIPNAFTPDASGHNDVLYVRGPYIKEMIFRIYNRWGQMVFESKDQHTGWNGTFKGKMLDPDVYDYYLEVTCVDGQKNIIKGNITLVR
jgi:gliding motility-associated-like protein